MYKMCKTEQSARRQQELEQALLAQMRLHHYDDISVSDLCDQMQIPRKAFYRYFSGKKGALHALLDHTLIEFERDYIGFAAMNTMGGTRRALTDFFRFWKEHGGMLDALQRSDLLGTLVGRATLLAFQSGAAKGDKPGTAKWRERKYATDFSVCGLMSVMLTWYHGGFEESVETMAEIAERIMQAGGLLTAEVK